MSNEGSATCILKERFVSTIAEPRTGLGRHQKIAIRRHGVTQKNPGENPRLVILFFYSNGGKAYSQNEVPPEDSENMQLCTLVIMPS